MWPSQTSEMVGMSGVELLEHLKAVDPGIEVIMLTAYETVDTLRLALRLGACDYLNKPFDIATMRKSGLQRDGTAFAWRGDSQQRPGVAGTAEGNCTTRRWPEEITRTRGEIYASIIHDINGPLNGDLGIHPVDEPADWSQRSN